MLAILPAAIALLLMYFVDVDSAHRRYNKKFLDAFAVMAVSVAGYLMVVIIFDQVFVISLPGQNVCFMILLLLIMSPAVIVVRAHKTESKQREEPALALRLWYLVRTMLSHKENLNLVQAMCKLDFWHGEQLQTKGDPLATRAERRAPWCRSGASGTSQGGSAQHLRSLPPVARSGQAFLHRSDASSHECRRRHHLLRFPCVGLHGLRVPEALI
ncbi:hypothetical protein VPH35_132660 [Triticum aestivum]